MDNFTDQKKKKKNMDKTDATKDMREKAVEGLIWKKDGLQDLIM